MRVLGKVSDVAAEGTVRGFYVDGSRDGDYEDGAGRMQVKWYSYSGIESQVSQGDWVVVEGILMQSDASSPYTSGYYIRPSSSAGIQLITQMCIRDRCVMCCATPPFSAESGRLSNRASWGGW